MPSRVGPFGSITSFFGQPFGARNSSKARMCVSTLSTLVVSLVLLAQEPAQITNSPAAVRPRGESISEEPGGYPDFPPLPKADVSLIGGTVIRIDPIHDRMVVRAFGGRDVTIDFDVRTKVVRGSIPAAVREIRPGTRIYADTILNDRRIFAKTVHIETNSALGDARGQVTAYDAAKGILSIRDIISSQPLTLRVTGQTEIHAGGQSAQPTELVDGTLVQITFRSATDGPSAAEKIDILARPGSTLTFAGRIAVIDLRDAHLTLYESSGENTFEVGLRSLPQNDRLRLKQGMDVIVRARFDGRTYQAQSIEPTSPSQP